jgi:hypothetical protein
MKINRIVKAIYNYQGRSADGASSKKEIECKFCGVMHEYGARLCSAVNQKTCVLMCFCMGKHMCLTFYI